VYRLRCVNDYNFIVFIVYVVGFSFQNGWNALMYATMRGNMDVVHALVGHGATFADENSEGDNVLAIACKCQHHECVEYFLESGVRATRKEAMILIENGNVDILRLFVSGEALCLMCMEH
jgi:ankyrin repeat protein